jgi:hypothetical protein
MAKNPLNDELYDGNDEQIDDLKDQVRELLGDIEYLLPRAHRHLVEAARIDEIRNRIALLNTWEDE